MIQPMGFIRLTLVSISLALICFGCQTVPKEVVELSYVMGKDLEALNTSYDKLIHQYYENLRDQRRVYLDDTWYPRFIVNWREDGALVAIAKEERIWSEENQKLLPVPAGSAPKESLAALNDWVTYALYAYEVKESELLAPLNSDEENLREQVRQAFVNITRANATITAHLNSLREVQEVQDEALKALNLNELRDEINKQLINASEKAKKSLEKIKEADEKVEKTARKLGLSN